jgi:hypothetical protein
METEVQAPPPQQGMSQSDTAALLLAQILESRQAFRSSALASVRDTVPADICARFLLSAPALDDPLERLVASLSMHVATDPPTM